MGQNETLQFLSLCHAAIHSLQDPYSSTTECPHSSVEHSFSMSFLLIPLFLSCVHLSPLLCLVIFTSALMMMNARLPRSRRQRHPERKQEHKKGKGNLVSFPIFLAHGYQAASNKKINLKLSVSSIEDLTQTLFVKALKEMKGPCTKIKSLHYFKHNFIMPMKERFCWYRDNDKESKWPLWYKLTKPVLTSSLRQLETYFWFEDWLQAVENTSHFVEKISTYSVLSSFA